MPGPEPKSTSSTERTKLASSGTKLNFPKSLSKVQHAEGGEQQATAHHALREFDEQEIIADRVAQTDHEDQTDAGEQQNCGQKELVAAEAAQTPPDVRQQESGEEQPHPERERTAEPGRRAHYKKRFEQTKLVAGDHAANATDVGQTAREVVDLARRFLPLAHGGDHGQCGQQIFARGQCVEIEQLFRRQALLDFRQRLRLRLVNEVQPRAYRQRRRQCPDELPASPSGVPARYTALFGAFYRPASCDCHMWRSFLITPTGPDLPCSISSKRNSTLSRLVRTRVIIVLEFP